LKVISEPVSDVTLAWPTKSILPVLARDWVHYKKSAPDRPLALATHNLAVKLAAQRVTRGTPGLQLAAQGPQHVQRGATVAGAAAIAVRRCIGGGEYCRAAG
jgi:hypothetical protein